MPSDSSHLAGRSAVAGYLAARRGVRHRRAAQAVVLAGGVLAALFGVGPAWRAGVVALSLLGVRLCRPQPDGARWLRGAEGEASTALLLERLPARRWVVFHDRRVPGTRANLDHVAIGPTGVWVIDSKAFRAPLHGRWRSVRAGDRPVSTAAAAWEATVVAERLRVGARPVLAVHGSGLADRGRRVGGVRVVPAPALVERLRRRRGSAHLRRQQVRDLAARFDEAFPPATSRGGPPAHTSATAGASVAR